MFVVFLVAAHARLASLAGELGAGVGVIGVLSPPNNTRCTAAECRPLSKALGRHWSCR
jgi:hypothetical protein